MNSPQAAQPEQQLLRLPLLTHTQHLHFPQLWFVQPWILRKVHQHRLSAGGSGFPGLPMGSCSRSCGNAQNFHRLKATARFYFLSDVKSCVAEGRENSLSQSIPEEPRISSSHRHVANERLIFHPGAALGTAAASRERHKEVPALPVSLTTLPGAAAETLEHSVEQLLT